MRATTVRFGEALWKLLEREAEADGVSAAQFIRDAAVMRIAYAMGQRGDTEFEAALERSAPASSVAPAMEDSERRQALRTATAATRDPERLEALNASGLLDAATSPSFDRHARLAAQVLNTPMAMIALVDTNRQFFVSSLGLPEPWASQRESPLSHSFCQFVIARRATLAVSDAREHELLRDSPAIRDIGVIAYAGIPLINADDHALGTLCVIDRQPRHWTTHQVSLLTDLAASVVTEIGLAEAAAKAQRAGEN